MDTFIVHGGEILIGVKPGDLILDNGMPISGPGSAANEMDDAGRFYQFSDDYSSVIVLAQGGAVTIEGGAGNYGANPPSADSDGGDPGGYTGPIVNPPADNSPNEPPNPDDPNNPYKGPANAPAGSGPGNGSGPGDIPAFAPDLGLAGAPQPQPHYEPLVLDVDGAGVQTRAINQGVFFDIDNSDFKTLTGWAAAGDGLLIYDPGSTGDVADGSQLFGTSMTISGGGFAADGFQALAQFDGNQDGKIDASDTVWSSLKVWVDANADGLVDSGELESMPQVGISALNLTAAASGVVDPQGNIHLKIGSWVGTDSLTHELDDVSFAINPTITTPDVFADIPAEIAQLPNLTGYGAVTTLHQAMVQDTSETLTSLMQQFVAATDDTTRNSLVDQIIVAWADVSNVAAGSRGSYFNAQELVALEKFIGQDFVGTSGSSNPGRRLRRAREGAQGPYPRRRPRRGARGRHGGDRGDQDRPAPCDRLRARSGVAVLG